MKKINIQAASSLLIVLFFISITGAAHAATASLFISPASATKNVGETITATVGIDTVGNKIYALEGTLVFDNITCQGIAVASGLQALAAPSCDNPHFLLGIPSGTVENKNLLTVTVKAGTAGTATINITGVNIVGGETIKSLSTAAGSVSYTISSAPKIPNAVVEQTAANPKQDRINKSTKNTATTTVEEVAPIETSTTTADNIIAPKGTVLAGYEENNPTNEVSSESSWFSSKTAKAIGAIIVIAIILFAGLKIFRQGKNKQA